MKKMINILLAAVLTACSSNETVIDSMIDPLPNGNPSQGKAVVFTTTADNNYNLYQQESEVISGKSLSPNTIQMDLTNKNQTIDGFGFAITYSSCYNLLKMDPADRADLLKRTFSVTEGYGVSYCRMSIGCSDFSSTEYTLCDKKGLENFRLYSDETDYVIPILKEILAINPKLKIIASPWTCPKWMKVDNLSSMKPHDSWVDGHLNPEYYDTYAQYFVKFVEAMKAQGINIYAVTPQNEPLNHGNCASTYMPWDEQAKLVKSMAAAFKKASLTTQIYVFDHNYNYDNQESQNDYPIKVYNALGDSYEGSELVVGAAYHDYGGTNEELDDIYAQAPEKSLIFSESSIGVWNDGRNLSKRLLEDMKNIALGTVNKRCRAAIVWNFMLDTKMGPNLDGGCQTCYGAIDIDPSNYKNITRNSHYYIITHMSAAAETGAVHVGTNRNIDNSNIISSCFLNPDGTYGAVVLNTSDNDITVNISDGSSYVRVDVPANGVSSVKWKK
jgi:glucosylceramidase